MAGTLTKNWSTPDYVSDYKSAAPRVQGVDSFHMVKCELMLKASQNLKAETAGTALKSATRRLSLAPVDMSESSPHELASVLLLQWKGFVVVSKLNGLIWI